MHYSAFTELYEKLGATSKRLEKVAILASFLHKFEKNPEWIFLLKGKVVSDYDLREFGISTQTIIKAIARASGISSEEVLQRYNSEGDLGLVAQELLASKKQASLFSSSLSVDKVFTQLKSLLDIGGKGTVEKKISVIAELLVSSKGVESKYIIRTLLNDLRIGVADALILDSLTSAFFEGDEDIRQKIEEAYDKVNDFSVIYEAAAKGRKAIESIGIIPGVPSKVMLPVKVENIDEALRICGDHVAVEHKYDGFRVLIHKSKKGIKLFTRRLEDVTNQFPDIVEVISSLKGDNFIFDSEVVGYDSKTKKYRPFEAISQRIKRKYDIEELIRELPVEIMIFDVLYYNNESYLDTPFIERRKLLEKVIPVKPWKLRLSTQFISNDKEKIMEFYGDALKIGEEGVMIKKLDAPYRPGRRVGYIVKMKPVANDLDLVIVGAEYGTGKRAGALTSYIVACRNGDKFLEVGMVSSGLKEKEEMGTSYKEIDALLRPLIMREEGRRVFVKPKVIVSVTYQNIQPSTTYTSGFALRFPRITRYRPERGVYDIASVKEIATEAAKGRS